MRFLTGNALGNGNAFVAGFVCQHRAANHVADCPYVRQVGTAFTIYLDKAAFVFFQAYGFGVQAFGVWNTADGNDQFVEYFGFGFAGSSFVSNGNAFAFRFDVADFHAQFDAQTLLFSEVFEGFFGDLLVCGSQEGRRSFKNGNFCTHAVPYGTHFQTNHAGTDHAEFGRYFGQVQCAFVIQYVHVVDSDLWQRTWYGTGRYDDMFGFDNGFLAFVIDFDLVSIAIFTGKRSSTEQAGYFVFLEQEFHAAGQFGHDGIFALNHFGRVEFYVADSDTVFGKLVLRSVEMFAGLQQGFGRDTTYVQASTAQCRGIACFVNACINASGFETQLRGTDGGNVSARACTNHYYIILRHRVILCFCSISK